MGSLRRAVVRADKTRLLGGAGQTLRELPAGTVVAEIEGGTGAPKPALVQVCCADDGTEGFLEREEVIALGSHSLCVREAAGYDAAFLRRRPVDTIEENWLAYLRNGTRVTGLADVGDFVLVLCADGVTEGYLRRAHVF